MVDGSIDDGYLVMPLYAGDLGTLIEQDREHLVANFVDLVLPLVEGLRVAHGKNILHRDIKPLNVLYRVQHDGALELALTDFGISKLTSSSLADTPVGTAKFMAPETFLGNAYDERADIYSLGVTFYEMLIGEWPINFAGIGFGGLRGLTKPSDVIDFGTDSLPTELSALLERMTSFERDRRLSSTMNLLNELLVLHSDGAQRIKIDDVQKRVSHIYSEQNDARNANETLSRALARVTAIVNTVKYAGESETPKRAAEHLKWLFAWLCSYTSLININLSEAIWSKYPARCPYCEQATCGCALKPTLDEKRSQLLRIYRAGGDLRQTAPNHPIRYFSDFLDNIYCQQNASATPYDVALRLLTEVGELQTVTLRREYLRSLDSNLLACQELGDVLAWMFALCRSLDIDVQETIASAFDDGCPRCGGLRCSCTGGSLDLVGEEWDDLESFLTDGDDLDEDSVRHA